MSLMKMKDKLPKGKRGVSLNESSSTLVESSFSKITFRKRGHDHKLDMSDIGEEEDNQAEGINQSNVSQNNTEYNQSKKKKKKKKEKHLLEGISDSVPQMIDVCKEGLIDGDEDKPVIDLGVVVESNELNCSLNNLGSRKKKTKKKKKTYDSEDPLYEHNSNKGALDINEDEEKSERKLRELEQNQSPVKKNKKKHKLSLTKEESEDIHHRERHSPIKEQNINRFEVVSTESYSNIRNDQFSGSIQTLLDSPSKKHKRKSSQTGENISEAFENVDSSLVHEKKKKTKKLMDESNLNISSNENIDSPLLHKKKKKSKQLINESNLNISSSEQHQNYVNGTEKNLVLDDSDLAISQDTDTSNAILLHKKKKKRTHKLMDESNLNIPFNYHSQNEMSPLNTVVEACSDLSTLQTVQSVKKKHKSSIQNLNIQNETLCINDGNAIKGLDTEFNPHSSKINKRSSSVSKLKSSALVPDSPEIKQEGFEENFNEGKRKKKHKNHKELLKNKLLESITNLLTQKNNMSLEERKSKHFTPPAPNESSISYRNPSGLGLKEVEQKNKKKDKDHKEKQKIGLTSSVVLNSRDSTTAQLKKKRKIKNNIETLRTQLLKEALSGKEESEYLPFKSTKPKTKDEKGVENLKMQLLKEVCGDTKKSENVHSKSTKQETKVEENIDTLRRQLLKNTFNNKDEAEDLSSKSNKRVKDNSKDDLPIQVKENKIKFHEDSRDKTKSKKKHKCKKINDIDKLTDILISKALEKISSSNASHSSQENINSLNVERKGVDFKKHGTIQSKIIKEKKHKSIHSEPKTDRVQEQELEHKSGIGEIQKFLLNDALRNINSKSKSLKLKKKTLTTDDKSTSKNYSDNNKKLKKKYKKDVEVKG